MKKSENKPDTVPALLFIFFILFVIGALLIIDNV